MSGVRGVFAETTTAAVVLAAVLIAHPTAGGAQDADGAAQRLRPSAAALAPGDSRMAEGEDPDAPPAVAYDPGSFRLAVGEILTTNFITWLFNEYVTDYKDITRISPTTWRENVATGPQWDDNHFQVNMLMHPYQGNLYFNAGRSNSYSFEESYLFAVFGSLLWECCGESHSPSGGDLATTTLGGAALGEMTYRWTGQLLNRMNAAPRPPLWPEVLTAALAPPRTLSRWLLDRFDAPNPTFVEPQSWDLFFYGGVRTGPTSGFLEVGYTYADVNALLNGSRPFDHFESVVQFDMLGQAKTFIARVQSRGSLWPVSETWVFGPTGCQGAVREEPPPGVGLGLSQGVPGYPGLSQCNALYLRIVPYHGFDYINTNSYEFGGQALGASTFVTFGTYPFGTYGIVAGDAQTFFGGIQSEHAHEGEIHDVREREREYDFGWGWGWGAAGIFVWQSRLRLAGFYRWNDTSVLHGSNANGNDAWHVTELLGGSVTARVIGGWGIGVDFRRYERLSTFTGFTPQIVQQTHDRWGLFLTYDSRLRPLGLFVF